MNQKTYNIVSGVVFLIVSVLHLSRAFWGWSANIDGLDIPLWFSWIAFVGAGCLAYQGLHDKQ